MYKGKIIHKHLTICIRDERTGMIFSVKENDLVRAEKVFQANAGNNIEFEVNENDEVCLDWNRYDLNRDGE